MFSKLIIRYLLITFCVSFFQLSFAQQVTVINQKGTKIDVVNNKVFTSPTDPNNPTIVAHDNDVWFDTTTNITKIYTGTIWKEIDPDAVTIAATAPAIPVTGDIWFDNSNASSTIPKVWNGTTSSWVNFPVADGSETIVTGAGINTVSGAGTATSPYIVTGTEVDGSVTNEINTSVTSSVNTMTVTDSGGSKSAPIINSNALNISSGKIRSTVNGIASAYVTLPVADGAETKVTGAGINVVTGTGSSASPYIISGTELDGDSTNEIQTLARSGTDVTLSRGGGTISIADNDNNSSNELTDLSLTGNILKLTKPLTGTNQVTLPVADGSETKVSGAGINVVTGAGTIASPYIITGTEVDGSVTNEINTAFGVVDVSGTKKLRITDANGNLDVSLSDLSHTGTPGSVFFAGTNGAPTENNGELFFDNTSTVKKFGIGTNSPTNKLEVSGAIGTQGVLNSNGSVNEPSYRFKNDTDTGIFRPDLVDQMGIVAGGVEAIHVEENSSITLVTIKHNLKLDGKLLDTSGDAGTNGQVLSSTVTGTNWINATTDSQTLSITGDQLTISGGNTVTLPTLTVTKETIGYVFAAAHTLANGTNSFKINCSVTKTATGKYTVAFTTPHPNGANYDIALGAQGNTTNSSARIASVVSGTQTANGFDVIVTYGGNGITADTLVDEVWYFNTSATKEVVTGVTQTTAASTGVTPVGTLVNSTTLYLNHFQDLFDRYFQLKFQNKLATVTHYEVLVSNTPYSTIPNLTSSNGSFILTSSANVDGTYNHLITSTTQAPAYNEFIINGAIVNGANYNMTSMAPITVTFYTR